MKRVDAGLLFRILVTAATLTWFFRTVRLESLLDRLAGVRWGIVAPAFLIHSLWIVPSTLRWMGIARLGGYRLTFGLSARCFVIGAFFNSFLPTGNGGDLIRGLLASRKYDYPLGGILGTILVERVIGMMVSLCLLLVTGFTLFSGTFLPKNVLVSASVLLVCTAAAGLALTSKKIRSGVKPLLEKGPFRPFHGGARNAARVFDACWANPRALGSAVLLSLVNQSLPIVSGCMMSLAIPDFKAPFYVFLVVMPLSFIAVLLPSIGGYGVREAGFILFFGWFGVHAEPAAVFGIIRLLFIWSFGLFGAGTYILDRRGDRKRGIPSALNLPH
jgi:glycosyltransferase 2 family protein